MTERDEDLGKRFAELRNRDLARTPSYESVVGGAARRRRTAPVPWLAAAVVIVLVGAGVFWSRGRREPQDSWLANWRSPTASLLQAAGTDVVSKVPSVSESVIKLEDQ